MKELYKYSRTAELPEWVIEANKEIKEINNQIKELTERMEVINRSMSVINDFSKQVESGIFK